MLQKFISLLDKIGEYIEKYMPYIVVVIALISTAIAIIIVFYDMSNNYIIILPLTLLLFVLISGFLLFGSVGIYIISFLFSLILDVVFYIVTSIYSKIRQFVISIFRNMKKLIKVKKDAKSDNNMWSDDYYTKEKRMKEVRDNRYYALSVLVSLLFFVALGIGGFIGIIISLITIAIEFMLAIKYDKL